MGIRTAVRPAMRAAEPATLRPALRHLFAQQRSVATQRAIDNWELLGSLALLWPRQRLVLAVHNALREEVDNTADEGERSALQLQLERVPALLARQRRRRDALSEVWTLRRSVLESVSRRLETHTLRALVRLTDLANQQPRVRLAKPAEPPRGRSSARRRRSPPPCSAARPCCRLRGRTRRRRATRRRRRRDDDDSWEAVAAGGGGWGDEAAEAMGRARAAAHARAAPQGGRRRAVLARGLGADVAAPPPADARRGPRVCLRRRAAAHGGAAAEHRRLHAE